MSSSEKSVYELHQAQLKELGVESDNDSVDSDGYSKGDPYAESAKKIYL